VRLAIRKVQFAPDKEGEQPVAEAQKAFLMSDKPLCLEASLDKAASGCIYDNKIGPTSSNYDLDVCVLFLALLSW